MKTTILLLVLIILALTIGIIYFLDKTLELKEDYNILLNSYKNMGRVMLENDLISSKEYTIFYVKIGVSKKCQ